MGELKNPRRLPWGMLICLALLTGTTITIHQYWLTPPATSASTTALVLLAGLAFAVGRQLLNYTWGMLLGLALVLHPTTLQLAPALSEPLRSEVWPLAALTCLVFLWRFLFQPALTVLPALPVFLVLALVSGFAWLDALRTGLVVTLLASLGLVLGAWLITRRRRRENLAERPHPANGASAWVLAVFAPFAGLLLAPVFSEGLQALTSLAPQALTWPGLNLLHLPPASEHMTTLEMVTALPKLWQPDYSWPPPGFRTEDLDAWTWPTVWVAAPLLLYGLWRTFYTGCRYWPTRRLPLSWLLLLYAGVTVAGVLVSPTALHRFFYPLVVLAVFLGIFGVADWLREVSETLVLAPPGEREK